ncbi:hypothetical protein [Pseudarthrobacter sp. SSS035]|uniref:hypothetical protein n=1 Tax=Pseudarthrobacter sp. SSS035 TaxID=2931399 RepID=UPI00200C3DE0|nr:hypothetical protein [Pseudarthrobacter sp. SSS035]
MSAASRGPVTAFLLRAGIVAGILAIIAGIFGMHVMTGNHIMHSPAAAQTPAAAVSVGDSHASHQSTPHQGLPDTSTAGATGHRVAGGVGAGQAASCPCSAQCTSVQAMSAACIPSTNAGALTAPEPGQGTLGSDSRGGLRVRAGASNAYVPGSPSPGELSISRT